MNKMKLTALLLAAAMGCGVFTACGSKKSGSTSSEVSSDKEAVTEEFDSESYNDSIMKDIEKAEVSDEPLTLGSVGKEVTPKEEDDDGDLGSYRETDKGTKLYYSSEAFPDELMLTLEQYFNSFANADYTTYSRCAYPDYLEKMEAYLQKEHGYDMKTSFATQCTNLANNMGGKFKVTRIKMDVPQQYDEEKDNLHAYFDNFTDILGEGYYDKLVGEVDNVYDGEFYVMAEGGRSGSEKLLISAYEIIFVEKDGRYYVFG